MNIVVTLAERDYLYGACVLYNSLVLNGFEGIYIIGYRDRASLPPMPLQALEQQGSHIEFIELDTPLHFANYKPTFMQQVLERYPDSTAITYFDPDIVVNCPCSWIHTWCQGGPSVCADVNWWLSSQHPTRRNWIMQTGFDIKHHLDLYYNSGFLSLRREDRRFLQLWESLITQYGSTDNPIDGNGELGNWRKGGRWLPFMTPDQDTLNIALMAWAGPITTLGPDAMGFVGAALMPHAIGTPKPWQKHFTFNALQGKPPRQVDKLYWSYANSHLHTHGFTLTTLKRLSISIASFIGRFYRRL